LTRGESKEQTRQDLLRAAATVFGRRGYAAATMQEIAEEAARTTGALYGHFASKEDLFLALLDGRDAVRQRGFESLADDTAGGFLQQLARGFDAAPDDDLGLLALEFYLYAVRTPAARDKRRGQERRARRGLATVLADLFTRSGREPPRAPEELAMLCIALGQGMTMLRRIDPDAVSGELFAYGLAQLTATAKAPIQS
jgi:AcrR family transcriptional regulator